MDALHYGSRWVRNAALS